MSSSRTPFVAVLLALAVLALTAACDSSSTVSPTAVHDEDEIEGLVTGLNGSCPALTFRINGTAVVANAATKYEYGTCTQIANGKKVEVLAAPGSTGPVVAAWIVFY